MHNMSNSAFCIAYSTSIPSFLFIYLFTFTYLFCSSVEFLVEKERKRIIWFLGRGQNCLQGVFPHRKTLQDVLHCHHLRMALPNPSD